MPPGIPRSRGVQKRRVKAVAPRRQRGSPLYWLVTASAVATSFWVGLNLPLGDRNQAPAIMRGSLPPATSVVGGINGLSRAASARLAAEIAAAAAREQQARFTVPPHFQGKTITHVDLAGDRKVIALTFDDGPWPESTNAILYILRKHDVRATFFLLGRNIRNFPERARQVAEHGHAIANHSWSHPYHQQTPASAAGQIDNTDIWIEQATGVRSQLFRPPGATYTTAWLPMPLAKGKS
ncbi:MAG: polysaccharide deacetylase family protein [Spirulinaceae cyanobacterium RM2_2_10]|nr:polysaccharide deacetylase family protein [Spirulinaceae cyanobacterium RM2_2_10]